MGQSRIFLTLSVLLVIFLVGCSQAATPGVQFSPILPPQACSQFYYEARATDVLLSLNGSRAAFKSSTFAGGEIDEESTVYFQWSDIREYGRTTQRCAPTVNDLLYSVSLSECQCTVSNITSVTQGVLRTGVELTIFGCPAPQSNVVAKASFMYTNVTVSEVYNNTMPGSPYDSFTYTSPAGDWKFSIHVEDWTWNTTTSVLSYYPNNTYVAAGLIMGFESSRNSSISMVLDPLSYSLHSRFGATDIKLTMDLGLLLDGQASIPDFFNAFPNLTFVDGMPFIGADMPLPFCEPTPDGKSTLVKWKKMYSDPSVQVIFGSFTPDKTTTASQKKANKVVTISASVVVVAVVLIIAAIITGVLIYRKDNNPFLAARRQIAEAKASSPSSSSGQQPSAAAVENDAKQVKLAEHQSAPSWTSASRPTGE